MRPILRACLGDRADEALADLRELYARRAAKGGRIGASIRLAFDLVSLMAVGLRGPMLTGLPGDIRYAFRTLRASPSFSSVAIVILALGIGANTAVFTVVNAMLLKPIASERARAVGVYARSTNEPDRYRAFSYDDYRRIREAGLPRASASESRGAPFDDVMAYTVTLVGVTEGGDTRRASAVVATSNYFSVLQTRLAIGREFTEEEEEPGNDIRVVIITHHHWQRLGGAASVLGTTVRLNGLDYTIVGVVPERFTGTTTLLTPDFWLPTGVYERVSDEAFREQRLGDPATRGLMMAARLTPGLDADDASPQLAALSARWAAIDPAANARHTLIVQKLSRLNISQQPSSDAGPTVVSALLMATASLVLLLASLNLANMLLARGSARRREIAVRVAVGGGRLRIVRQLLVESLLLAAVGSIGGLVLAFFSLDLLISSARAVFPLALRLDISPDVRVLAATIAFSLISTIAAGLGPAWRASRPDVLSDLKDQPAHAAGVRRLSVRNVLVIAQVAVCLALLVSAGLFVRGAIAVAHADPGFPTDRNLVVRVDPRVVGYTESQSRATMMRLMQRLRAIPGIEAASFGSQVPYGDEHDSRPVIKASASDDAPWAGAAYTVVGAAYFEALGIPILRGRGFSLADESSNNGAPVAVIDRALSAKVFGNEDPLGQEIRFARGDGAGHAMQVVGVVGGIRDGIGDREPSSHVYVPYGQAFTSAQYLHVRVRQGTTPSAFLDIVSQTVTNVDPQLPVLNLKTLDAFVRGSLQVWVIGAAAWVFCAFGLSALILAVIGVYGMKVYVVSRRTREIAIRLALGATPHGVLWMIVGEGLALTAVGLTLGLAAAVGAGRVLSAILFGVSPADPLVFAGAIGLLGSAALLATYIPARRATKLAPSTALRAD